MSASFKDTFLGGEAGPSSAPASKRTVQLIAIGQGRPKFARDFVDTFKFHGAVYIDPTKDLFTKLHFVNKIADSLECSCDLCCSLTCHFVYGCCCKCWCPCQVGDMAQNGGVLIINRNGELIYKHVEREVDDHPNYDLVLKFVPTKAVPLATAMADTDANAHANGNGAGNGTAAVGAAIAAAPPASSAAPPAAS